MEVTVKNKAPALNNYLIDHWDINSVPQSKIFHIQTRVEDIEPPQDDLYELHLRETKPACGNLHAGTGNKRVITEKEGLNIVHTYNEECFLDEFIDKEYKKLGQKVLISAGHFMPHKKSNFLNVNSNSITSLIFGLKYLKKLRKLDIEADLLITINDLTISSDNDEKQTGCTLTIEERASYYTQFSLPKIYNKLINDCRETCSTDFNVFVVGENKLAEKLRKDTKKLVKNGVMEKTTSGYALTFDSSNEREIAHGINIAPPMGSAFISTQPGATGKPKCVRACARLSAIPQELGYDGYLQFLPVCSRNAIEGFLIGRKLYDTTSSFISVHNTFSCF